MAETDNAAYFPPPESEGGWSYLTGPAEIRELGGMDPDKLERIGRLQLLENGGDSWSIVIVRHGRLVKELYTFNVLKHTRFDIWSGTKSFTGTAWGLLLDDSRQHRLPEDRSVDLDSAAYEHLPQGHPLSDPRKERIQVKHLLSMTSGIPGESTGILGMPTATDSGAFEHAFGKSPNRFGQWVAKLAGEPGTIWDYSDAAMCHLAVMFSNITGRQMSDYLVERVVQPIGIESFSWDVQGGSGFLGPYTNAHTGVHLSARELARFGYLALRKGMWKGREIVPRWWMELATRSSQELNPDYGYTWWVNTAGSCWSFLPRDAFALMGYRSNKCYVIPSLDLVVARVGSGPSNWNEQYLIGGIVDAIL